MEKAWCSLNSGSNPSNSHATLNSLGPEPMKAVVRKEDENLVGPSLPLHALCQRGNPAGSVSRLLPSGGIMMTPLHKPHQWEPAWASASGVSIRETYKTHHDQEVGKVPRNSWGYTYAKPTTSTFMKEAWSSH